MNITRRGFMQLMGALGVGAALTRDLATAVEAVELPEEIDVEFTDSHALGLFIVNSRGQEHSVGMLREISGPTYDVELIDVTYYGSDYRELLPGRGATELTSVIAGHASPKMSEAFENRTLLRMRMRLGKFYAYEFSGYVVAYEINARVDGLLETIFRFQLSGPVVMI